MPKYKEIKSSAKVLSAGQAVRGHGKRAKELALGELKKYRKRKKRSSKRAFNILLERGK